MASLAVALARLGLRAKIALIAGGVMLFALGGTIAASDYFFDRELTAVYQSRSLAVGKGLKLQLERLLQFGIRAEDLTGFEEQLQGAVGTYADIDHAMVVRPEGTILFHSDPRRMGQRLTDPSLLGAFELASATVVRHRADGLDYFSAVIPVGDLSGMHAASIVVSIAADSVERRSNRMGAIGLAVGLVFLAAGTAILLTALSVFVTRPLSRLMEAVEGIQGDGEAPIRVPIASQDEVGRLAGAFNAMAGRLETVIQREREAAATQAAAREQIQRSTQLETAMHELERAQDATLNLLEDIDHRRQELEAEIETRRRAEAAVNDVNRVLRVLSAGNAALVQASDEAALLADMCRILVNVGGYRMAWIGFAQHDDAKTVRPLAHAGHDDGYLDAANIVWADNERGRGPTGTAIRTGLPQVNQDFIGNAAMAPWREAAAARGFASSIALPLKGRSGTFGALTIYAAEADAFDPDEVKLLVELSDDLSYGIAALRNRAENDVAAERLQRSMETTIEVVAGTVEQRDPYTAGHQRRVAILAEAMARRMSLSEDRVHGLRLAGIVHDLGKIYIPAEILSKPSRLTPVEYELIKSHAQVGYDILKNVDFPWPIAKMVVQHHERMDGTGYPHGLKGDDILLESRILAVADVVESMMSHRPYRPSRGIDVALAEIERGRGTAYDPAAVDACLALFRQDGFAFD